MQKLILVLSLFVLCAKAYQVEASYREPIAPPPQEKHISTPNRIYISSINLFLPITISPVVNEEWQMSDEKTAFYGQGSSLPGESGTTVVFAHAKNGLFSRLPILKKGSTIILTDKSHVYKYRISHKELLKPESVGFIQLGGPSTLAIFTCYGFNDTHRIVFFAKFEEKIKIQPNEYILYHI